MGIIVFARNEINFCKLFFKKALCHHFSKNYTQYKQLTNLLHFNTKVTMYQMSGLSKLTSFSEKLIYKKKLGLSL